MKTNHNLYKTYPLRLLLEKHIEIPGCVIRYVFLGFG